MIHDSFTIHRHSRWLTDNMDNRHLVSPLEFARTGILFRVIRTYLAYCPAIQQHADSSPGPKVVTKAPACRLREHTYIHRLSGSRVSDTKGR